jgi:S-adenosylmethionine hydrolase
MTVITLLTDFGTRDGYAGVMKGVIWKIAPDVQIADLSHEITPQDVMEAALLLKRVVAYFQGGTIHVGVIDPGVGTKRRGIAAQMGSQFFVGPDNGLFSLVKAEYEKQNQNCLFVSLDQPQYWLSEISSTFHGRDLFAPVAAHLAQGIPLSKMGSPFKDPVEIQIPLPLPTSTGWIGRVIHIDHFGNLSTNLSDSHIRIQQPVIKIKDEIIRGISVTFGDRPKGSIVALIDSTGSLAICVVNGSAAQYLQSNIGDEVEILT